eukprot:g4711.t1
MHGKRRHRGKTAESASSISSLLAKHGRVKRRRKNPTKSKALADAKAAADAARNAETGMVARLRELRSTREALRAASARVEGDSPRKTLALCFLCVENLPHEAIWREWISQAKASAYDVRVYVHAKFPERLQSAWAKHHLIRDSQGHIINYKPDWGKIEVTRALLKLFDVALRDDDVGRLVYASESCIPVRPFEDACAALWSREESWMNAYSKPVDGYDAIMFNSVNRKCIPRECVQKCDTWVMLTRLHAVAALDELPRIMGCDLWPHFSRVKVADEIYLPTIMTIIGALDTDPNAPGQTVSRRKVTHVDWSAGGPHPRAFEKVNQAVIDEALRAGSIFARKFATGTADISDWSRLCGRESCKALPFQVTGSAEVAATKPTMVQQDSAKRNLVIIPAGDNALLLDDHVESRWGKAEEATFDICTVYYGSDAEVASKYAAKSTHFFRMQGPKWQLVRAALKKGFWKGYEFIWMPDDDLLMDVASVNKFLKIAKDHSLQLCQPALIDLNVEHRILVQDPSCILRYSNFVEIQAPLVSRAAMDVILPTIDDDDIKSGWGLDFVWPFLLRNKGVAIVDETPMVHTRPVTAFNPDANFYRKYKIDPQLEGYRVLRKYRVPDNIQPHVVRAMRR